MGKPTHPDYLFNGFGRCAGNWDFEYREAEYIGFVKRTRGTETSQYLEEKTSTEIPSVVASERGPGQRLKFN